jgi:prevent-host-death family protein
MSNLDVVATGSYHVEMEISVKEAKNKLTELLRRVEAGEAVTITRDGTPVADVVKHVPKKKGVNWEALRAYKREHGITRVVEWIAPDFDDPLPEDFLITKNAEEKYLAEQAKKKIKP